MKIEEIIAAVSASKKYSNIAPQTIQRICQEELGKYKKPKDVVHAAKRRLHAISESFLPVGNLEKLKDLEAEVREQEGTVSPGRLEQLLQLHVSTKERIGFYQEMYRDIFKVVGDVDSILDIACGLNPISYVLSGCSCPGIRYEATDINLDNVQLLNWALKSYDLQQKIYCSDILCSIPQGEWGVVFLFKIIPLLEQQKKGYFCQVIRQISSPYFAITFPTRSLSGKDVGMQQYYKSMLDCFVEESGMAVLFEKAYANELLFVVKK